MMHLSAYPHGVTYLTKNLTYLTQGFLTFDEKWEGFFG